MKLWIYFRFRRNNGHGETCCRFDPVANNPTETFPIDYSALRGPDLYAILYEDRRALFLARAEQDDSIVRLIDALGDAALEWLLAYATTSGKRRAEQPTLSRADNYGREVDHLDL